MWVVLILGLIAAGIYTGNAAFYVAAGIVGAIILLFMMIAAAGVRAIKKKVVKGFGDDNTPVR